MSGSRVRLMAFAARAVAFAFCVLLPIAAVADEVEEHHAAPGIPWAKIAFSTINLLIFLFIVVRMVKSLDLPKWFAERRHRIAEALAEADRARREAEGLRAEWQRRLDNLGGELEAMLAQARVDIAAERDQILAAARKTAEAIHRDAQRTAESEIRNAQAALRGEVAAQALAIAEKMAPQRVTPADRRRFVAEFVQEIEGR